MAYTPTEWQSGDIVTSEKLNKIENGIAGAGGGGGGEVFMVGGTYNEETGYFTMDKTWSEINEAITAGMHCLLIINIHLDQTNSVLDRNFRSVIIGTSYEKYVAEGNDPEIGVTVNLYIGSNVISATPLDGGDVNGYPRVEL